MNISIIKQRAFINMENIKRIVFLNNSNSAPSDAEDFSKNKDKSVVGWYANDALYIAPTNGNKIIANKDSSFMFYNCINLSHIDGLKNLDTSGVLNMASMFACCESLKNLDLQSFNTSNVRFMEEMFYRCIKLSKLNLASFNTSNVLYMSKMFMECRKLIVLNLSSFNTKNVIDMEQMFYNCQCLNWMDISGFIISKTANIEKIFAKCKQLNKIEFKGKLFNINSFMTYINSLF